MHIYSQSLRQEIQFLLPLWASIHISTFCNSCSNEKWVIESIHTEMCPTANHPLFSCFSRADKLDFTSEDRHSMMQILRIRSVSYFVPYTYCSDWFFNTIVRILLKYEFCVPKILNTCGILRLLNIKSIRKS